MRTTNLDTLGPLFSNASQMLWVKNKATWLLIVKNMLPPKHYLLTGIMLLGRRPRRAHLHHINTGIEMRRNEYDSHILIIHLLFHSIKHIWISTMLMLHWYLRLVRRRVLGRRRRRYPSCEAFVASLHQRRRDDRHGCPSSSPLQDEGQTQTKSANPACSSRPEAHVEFGPL